MRNKIEVVHALSGRTRVKFPHMEQPVLMEACIRNIPGVLSATCSRESRTALIYHGSLSTATLLNELDERFDFRRKAVPIEQQKDAADGQNPKLKDLRLVLLALLAEKVVGFSTPAGLISLLRPTAVATLFASREIIRDGIKSLFKPNEDTLTTTALFASLLKGTPGSAVIIYSMSTVSELLNEYTIKRTRGFVRDMMEVDAKTAWRLRADGSEERVPVEVIAVGDEVMVFQGEKVPFDGEVTRHEAHIDQAAITGESMPVLMKEGMEVFAGSVAVEGKIAFRVSRVGADMTVNRMIRLIEDAQENQASIQTSTNRFTKRVVPLSFALAGVIYLVTRDWNRVLNALVIDYVCGIQLSTATAISATIGQAAKKGVLMKGGQTLEKLSMVDTLVLDKTGTITEGRPVVTAVHTFADFKEEDILAYAASVEEHSSHPLAEAILSEAATRGIEPLPHEDETIENHVGKGVLVRIEGEKVLAGSRAFMETHDIDPVEDYSGGIYVAKGDTLIGIIEIEDKIRYGMNEMMHNLKKRGINDCVMITGDNEASAAKIAAETEIDHYMANAMPEDKAAYVQQLKRKGRRIMMVGDGINDAPALAHADIGVTMGGKKTDIAMETADVVIHSDNALVLSDTVEMSMNTMGVIRQNIIATFIINTGAILLGTFGIIRPVVGAAVHNAATIGVVANSARLLLKGEPRHDSEL